MSATAISALARLAGQRFDSFSEAAGSVLDLLEQSLPEGRLMLGQLDNEEGVYRVMETRGNTVAGIERGATLPVSSAAPDPEFLRSLSVKSFLAVPLETSDGSQVASLCALGADTGLYNREHVELLTVLGRLLAYEWEGVNARAELRRLTEQLRDRSSTDPVTGLPNRQTFAEALDREWKLTERGTVESYLAVLQVRLLDDAKARFGDAMANLLLKDAAEVFSNAIRKTDHGGRVGDDTLAAVLVGCPVEAGAAAFARRFAATLERAISGRPASVELALGTCALAGSSSPGEALERAEAAAAAATSVSLSPEDAPGAG